MEFPLPTQPTCHLPCHLPIQRRRRTLIKSARASGTSNNRMCQNLLETLAQFTSLALSWYLPQTLSPIFNYHITPLSTLLLPSFFSRLLPFKVSFPYQTPMLSLPVISPPPSTQFMFLMSPRSRPIPPPKPNENADNKGNAKQTQQRVSDDFTGIKTFTLSTPTKWWGNGLIMLGLLFLSSSQPDFE